MFSIFLQSLLWGSAMTLSAAFSLWLSYGLLTSNLPIILFMCFLTSVIGYILAMAAVKRFVKRQQFETQFAGYFLFLIVMTVGSNVLFFCLNYWYFYSQWHSPFLSQSWFWQFFFTNIGAAYQFAVMGLPLYLPIGLICLCVTAYMKAKRSVAL